MFLIPILHRKWSFLLRETLVIESQSQFSEDLVTSAEVFTSGKPISYAMLYDFLFVDFGDS